MSKVKQPKTPAADAAVRMTTAEATVAALIEHGIDTIYALPGVHNDPLFDALFKAADRIRTVHARHEQTAGYMALGDRKSTRLNSSHGYISYAAFCLKKKNSGSLQDRRGVRPRLRGRCCACRLGAPGRLAACSRDLSRLRARLHALASPRQFTATRHH